MFVKKLLAKLPSLRGGNFTIRTMHIVHRNRMATIKQPTVKQFHFLSFGLLVKLFSKAFSCSIISRISKIKQKKDYIQAFF